MSQRYEIDEKDIDSTVRYLKTVDPENATPETAIALLEHLKASVHMMAHENPEQLEKIYEELKSQRSARK